MIVSEPEVEEVETAPRQRSRRQKVFAVLPTLLTLCNAVCGFGAITIIARVGPDSFAGGDQQLVLAAQLIFLAMLFDALDGSAARLTNQASEFGAQLDSLCDVVSFGVAPAYLMLTLTHPEHHLLSVHQLNQQLIEDNANLIFAWHPRVLWSIAVLYMACAILRLARFNVETDDDDSHDSFSGLPSPAAAGVIVSFPLAIRFLTAVDLTKASVLVRNLTVNVLAALAMTLPLIALATAILMVSRIRYPHVFNQFLRGQRNRSHVLQLVFFLALVLVAWELAVPVIFCYFAFNAPMRAVWRRYIWKQPAAV
ncbi:MAG: CDP-alcohol phosphatidyltransferase family protein [Planctomycetaceae bacterium]|nr:CDP-alcohol phosphatidyltransferase family protein [Planctomycetaceae bacterium]